MMSRTPKLLSAFLVPLLCAGLAFAQDAAPPAQDDAAQNPTEGEEAPPAEGDAAAPAEGEAPPPAEGEAAPPAEGEAAPPAEAAPPPSAEDLQSAEQEYDLVPPMVLEGDDDDANLTLVIDTTMWFDDGSGGTLDPRDPADAEKIEDNIIRSIEVFEDDDEDGEDDDD